MFSCFELAVLSMEHIIMLSIIAIVPKHVSAVLTVVLYFIILSTVLGAVTLR